MKTGFFTVCKNYYDGLAKRKLKACSYNIVVYKFEDLSQNLVKYKFEVIYLGWVFL